MLLEKTIAQIGFELAPPWEAAGDGSSTWVLSHDWETQVDFWALSFGLWTFGDGTTE